MKLFNKELIVSPSKAITIKLKVLIDELERQYRAGEIYSQENLMSKMAELLSDFSSNITAPITNIVPVSVGEIPQVAMYNRAFRQIINDLFALYEESDYVENLIISSFNHIATEANALSREVRIVNSMLSDYSIFTDNVTSGITYFVENFSNFSTIETDEKFYARSKAEVNEAEGIITLDIDTTEPSLRNVRKVTIRESSNGIIGNNSQVGAQLNDNINTILDSNPDTWFEYEIVTNVNAPLESPLVLDIVLELSTEDIVNSIIVNPNNFGIRNPVKIKNIETSLDGETWKSIKDDIFAIPFPRNVAEDIFVLTTATSKYKGQGVYSFFPKKIKYFHIEFEQDTYHIIDSTGGIEKLRYAIGLRDIEVHGYKYMQESDLISSKFYAPSEVKKVSSDVGQHPEESSELVSISHFVSPDDGVTWHSIQPRNIQSSTGTEVMNFNTIDENAIATPSSVDFIRYKIGLKRNVEAFLSGTSTVLAETRKDASEIFGLTDASPLELTLKFTPIFTSVALMDPLYGSVGNNSRKFFVATSSGEANQEFELPWQYTEKDTEQIWIGNGKWTREPSLSDASATEKVYELDYEKGILKFGDGTDGAIPDFSSKIEVNFKPESIWIGHRNIVDLKFSTDRDKKNVIIKRIDKNKQIYDEILVKGATIHRLKNRFIDSAQPVTFYETIANAFQNEVAYKDGIGEFSGAPVGSYSINHDEGIVYSANATSKSNNASVSYQYVPKVTLSEEDWDFKSGATILKNSITIKDSAYLTNDGSDIPSVGINMVQLSNNQVKPGSLSISETGAIFITEIPFIDGNTELTGLLQVVEEVVPSGHDENSPFILKSIASGIAIASEPGPVFSDTIVFANETPTLTSPGDYNIDYNTGVIKTYSLTTEGGNVTYYYSNTTLDLSGLYSIDYEDGIVYTYDATESNTTIGYQYANYEVSYNIARLVDNDNYEVNAQNKKITVQDKEIADSIVRSRGTFFKPIVKVIYSYVDKEMGSLEELEPYYSPVVKGYSLSVIDSDSLSLK